MAAQRTLHLANPAQLARALCGALALLATAWALATLDLRLVAGAALLVAGSICALRWPWLAWVSVGALLPFAAAIKWGLVSLLDVVLLASFALWFIDGARRRQLRLAATAPAVAALLYAATLLLASLGARDMAQALAEVIKWLQFAAVLLIVPAMVGRGEVRWVAAGVLAGASAQALLGLYQFVNRIGPEWFVVMGRFMRASGSFSQPNPFAGYLGLVLPVALSLTIDALDRLWQQSWQNLRVGFRHNAPGTDDLVKAPDMPGSATQRAGHRRIWWPWLWALGCSAATVVIAAGLLASWSRGGWLAAALAGGAVIVLRSRRAAGLAALGALAAGLLLLVGNVSPSAAAAVVPAPVLTRLQEIPAFFGSGDMLRQEVNDDNFAIIERLAHWEAARRMFASSPWLGVGPGNYASVYPDVRLPQWREALGHAHNYYLNVLAEGGVLGITAFALLWTAIVVWALRRTATMRRAGATGSRAGATGSRAGTTDAFGVALGVGTLAMLVHLAAHSLVDNLFVQGMYVQVALWVALVAARSHDQPHTHLAPESQE